MTQQVVSNQSYRVPADARLGRVMDCMPRTLAKDRWLAFSADGSEYGNPTTGFDSLLGRCKIKMARGIDCAVKVAYTLMIEAAWM